MVAEKQDFGITKGQLTRSGVWSCNPSQRHASGGDLGRKGEVSGQAAQGQA